LWLVKDVVVAANVLHLVPDLPAALTAIRRVLRPGGRLIVPTYCHDETFLSWLVSRLLQVTGFPGKRRFTVEKLRQVIAGCDFEIICAAKVNGLMPIGYVEARVA
jgi:phosphatidylethanolamine/phosphatidyl-N-methylethanolamine N-methyltransferase